MSTIHCSRNNTADLVSRLDQMFVGQVCVIGGGSVPPVPEQLTDQRQILTRHDGVTGGSMAKVVQA